MCREITIKLINEFHEIPHKIAIFPAIKKMPTIL